MEPLTIMEQVLQERVKQDQLKASGKFAYTCRDYQLSVTDKLTVLMEEVGEVARCCLELQALAQPTAMQSREPGWQIKKLRQELIQVMAVCHAWLESL